MSSPWTVDPLLEGSGYSSTCTLLTSGDHRVIVDTGLSIQGDALLDALAARRLDPADIDLVINTHLHVDHCGNNALFARAAIYMSRDESRWTLAFYDALFHSRTPERVVAEFYPEASARDLQPRTVRNVTRLARLFWSVSRLGDERQIRWTETAALPDGLEILPTPGHTPHHLSIRVAALEPVVVAGDAVLSEDAEAAVRTMIPHSRERFLATRQALVDRGERIVPGHGRPFVPRPAGAPVR